MPIIQVQVIEGRSNEDISNLIENLTEGTVNSLGVKREQVRVIISEIPRNCWGVGGKAKEEEVKE
jgi:4-oxalocrotonate tautomerase